MQPDGKLNELALCTAEIKEPGKDQYFQRTGTLMDQKA
jgi:hypothetical protein